MLRKHDNVRLLFAPGLLTGKGWVTLQIGVRTGVRISKLHKAQCADYGCSSSSSPCAGAGEEPNVLVVPTPVLI